MVVQKIFQIFTHKKQMHQFLVNDFETANRLVGSRVEHTQNECRCFAGTQGIWCRRHFERILHSIGHLQHQRHAAARAFSCF